MNLRKKIKLVSLFAVAMGFMESAVVIYLRLIFYPDGFAFPLKPMDMNVFYVEFFREAATLVMLLSIGMLTGKGPLERFAWFIYTFAVWDIFYYVFLKAFIGWPESLLTWDILFLIPVVWTGPVLAPLLNSLSMILLALLIFLGLKNDRAFRLRRPEWILLILGSVVLLVVYMQDYLSFLLRIYNEHEIIPLNREIMETYIPLRFCWTFFIFGELLILLSLALIFKRSAKNEN